MRHRTNVIIAGTHCLSGVTTWDDQLRTALADHPRYHVQSLYVGQEPSSHADISAPTTQRAHEIIGALAPAVILPNYLWPLFLLGLEPGIHCIGMCHADDVSEYYQPLSSTQLPTQITEPTSNSKLASTMGNIRCEYCSIS